MLKIILNLESKTLVHKGLVCICCLRPDKLLNFQLRFSVDNNNKTSLVLVASVSYLREEAWACIF